MKSGSTSITKSLNQAGINIWISPWENDGDTIPPENLIEQVLDADDSQFKLAIIPLLLHHPELGQKFESIIAQFDDSKKESAKLFYTATHCLQRRWWTRLNIYDPQMLLKDLFSKELGLPNPEIDFGRETLYSIAEKLRSLAGMPYNYEKDFDRIINLYISQFEMEQK